MATSAASAGSAKPVLFDTNDSILSRMAGVVWAPRTTFQVIARSPRTAAVLLVTFALAFVANAILLRTEVGQLALLDQWERTAIAFGQPVGDAEYATLLAATANSTPYAAVTALASGPVLAAALALLLFAAFDRGRGGITRYRQYLGVTAYAGVILAIRQVIAAPVSYARETLASPTALSGLITGLDEASPVARFLGVLDVFVLWWLVVLAMGVAVLTGRPARRATLMFVAWYVGLALVLAGIMAAVGGAA